MLVTFFREKCVYFFEICIFFIRRKFTNELFRLAFFLFGCAFCLALNVNRDLLRNNLDICGKGKRKSFFFPLLNFRFAFRTPDSFRCSRWTGRIYVYLTSDFRSFHSVYVCLLQIGYFQFSAFLLCIRYSELKLIFVYIFRRIVN